MRLVLNVFVVVVVVMEQAWQCFASLAKECSMMVMFERNTPRSKFVQLIGTLPSGFGIKVKIDDMINGKSAIDNLNLGVCFIVVSKAAGINLESRR